MEIRRRQEMGKKYTTFSDSTATIELLRLDQPGPDQAIAEAIIYFEGAMKGRGCFLNHTMDPGAQRGWGQ